MKKKILLIAGVLFLTSVVILNVSLIFSEQNGLLITKLGSTLTADAEDAGPTGTPTAGNTFSAWVSGFSCGKNGCGNTFSCTATVTPWGCPGGSTSCEPYYTAVPSIPFCAAHQ